MTKPEFDYAYLSWFFKFFMCIISIDDPEALHPLHPSFLWHFPASISQDMVKK